MSTANECASIDHLIELGYADPLVAAEQKRREATALENALKEAQTLVRAGSSQQAIAMLESMNAEWCELPERRYLLARAYAQAGQLDRSLTELRWLELHGYESADFALLRATIALQRRQLHVAVDQAEYARALKSPNLSADLVLGEAYFRLRELSSAEAAYDRALATNDAHAGALAGLAAVRLRQLAYEASIDLALQSLDVEPRHAAVHYRLGLALLGIGRPTEAAAAFNSAVTLNTLLAGPHRRLAEIYAVNHVKAAEHRGKARQAITARQNARRTGH